MTRQLPGGSPRAEARQVSGYSVVLPPGWRRVPVQHGTRAAIRDITDEVFARMPGPISSGQAAPYRARIESHLAEMAGKLRPLGGVDLYLPIVNERGTPVPASFIVSQPTPPRQGKADPGQVAGYLAAADDASPVLVDGCAGARLERTAPAQQEQGIAACSRRVDYLLPVPGNHGRWLIVTFSTPGDGDPDSECARLLVELFDSIMLTFRWVTDQAAGATELRTR